MPELPSGPKVRGYAVHLLTASGGALALLAAAELLEPVPDPRRVFLLLLVTVVIDGVDGTLARRFEVKKWAAAIDGRTLDDIVDFLTFTFIPLLLVWRMGWVPRPAALFLVPPLLASLFGFANREAKQESDGFFRGFPSYWNVWAFYAGAWAVRFGPLVPGLVALALAVLTVAPVRFLYPTLAPAPWRGALLVGAAIWAATILAALPTYPMTPVWLLALSLAYPVFYVGLSLVLDRRMRRSSP